MADCYLRWAGTDGEYLFVRPAHTRSTISVYQASTDIAGTPCWQMIEDDIGEFRPLAVIARSLDGWSDTPVTPGGGCVLTFDAEAAVQAAKEAGIECFTDAVAREFYTTNGPELLSDASCEGRSFTEVVERWYEMRAKEAGVVDPEHLG